MLVCDLSIAEQLVEIAKASSLDMKLIIMMVSFRYQIKKRLLFEMITN